MTRDYPEMPQQLNLGQLVREHILVKGWRYVLVVENTILRGMLTTDRIRSVPRKRWSNTTLGDIMTPADKIRTANLQETADSLFEEMNQGKLNIYLTWKRINGWRCKSEGPEGPGQGACRIWRLNRTNSQ
jgi:hypothetical protein